MTKPRRSRAKRSGAADGRAEWFSSLVQHIHDVIFVVSQRGMIIYASPSVESALGYHPSELVGTSSFDVVIEEDVPLARATLESAIRVPGTPEPAVVRVRHRDGSWRAHEAIATALPPGGPLSGVVVSSRDITERLRVEESLQTVSERLQTFVRSSPIAIVTLDLEGRVTLWNPAAERLFGWTEAEILGEPLLTVPEHRREEHRALRERVLEGEGYEGVEVSRLRKDGSSVDVALSTAPLRDHDGRIVGALGMMTDVGERKRAEQERQRLGMVIEQASDLVILTDAQGDIQYVNPAFERITGYAPAEVIGKNPRLLKSGRHDAAFYREVWNTLLRGEALTARFVNLRKDGTSYTQFATIFPVRDGAGLTIGYACVGRDVTRETLLEEELRQAQKMEAVGRLAGGVTHDFNNLLTVILAETDMALAELAPDHPLRAGLDEIRQTTQRAASLTRQLLAFSRRQVVEPEFFSLNDLVADVEKMLRRLIGEDIELSALASPDLGPVKADRGHIEQVLVNLAVNARDAMPDGGRLVVETANVTLTEEYTATHSYAAPGEYVVLAVSDSGTGMTDEVKAHLFEPFFTTKEQGRGTGLGLATCYGIVKQHGGFISLYSELGIGSTFKVHLPRAGGAAAGPAPRVL